MKSWQYRWQQQPDEELEYHPVEPPPDPFPRYTPLYVHETRTPQPIPYHGGSCPWCRKEASHDPTA